MSEQPNMDFHAILASSVHDMKNSLAMVLGSLDEVMAEAAGNCPALSDKAGQLQYEAMRVNSNLVQLLTIYKLDSKQHHIQISDNELCDFLEECYFRNLPLLEFNNIAVEIDCDDSLFWRFDNALVQGLLDTVINNSLRYSKHQLRLSAEEEMGYLKISIEDDGAGFPEQMLTQGHVDNFDFNAGRTGLGLYFSQLIAESHTKKNRQGYIVVSNDCQLAGGCFSLYLP